MNNAEIIHNELLKVISNIEKQLDLNNNNWYECKIDTDYLEYQRSMVANLTGIHTAVFRDRTTKKIYRLICIPFIFEHRSLRIWSAYLVVDQNTYCVLSIDDANILLKKAKCHCPSVFKDINEISFIFKEIENETR